MNLDIMFVIIQEQMPEAEFIVVPLHTEKGQYDQQHVGKRIIYKYVGNM